MKTIKVTEISPTNAYKKVGKGTLLVDVREQDEVAQLAYDVPNIVNIPMSEFETRYIELPRDKELILVCRGGGRSLRAAGVLLDHGFTNVVNMQHGIIGWVKKGFPTKENTPSDLQNKKIGGCCSCCDSPNSDGGSCC